VNNYLQILVHRWLLCVYYRRSVDTICISSFLISPHAHCSWFIALAGTKHCSNILFWGGCRDHHPSSQAERPPPLPASSTSSLVSDDLPQPPPRQQFWTICRSRRPIHRGSGMVCCALRLGGGWFVCNTAAAMMNRHSRSIANRIKNSDRPSSAGRELGISKFLTCRAGAISPWAWSSSRSPT
jgi:hypothetical protein